MCTANIFALKKSENVLVSVLHVIEFSYYNYIFKIQNNLVISKQFLQQQQISYIYSFLKSYFYGF